MGMMLRNTLIFAILAAGPATAQNNMAQINLLPGWRTADGTHMAAIQISLAEGWKTYWRAPGEGGIPPSFDWGASENISNVHVHWPRPEVFSSNGLKSIGYSYEVILPVEITPTVPDQAINANLDLHIGICRDICVPVSAQLSADFGTTQTDPVSAIQWAVDLRPDTQIEAGVHNVTCKTEEIRDGIRLSATMDAPELVSENIVVELSDSDVWVSEAQSARNGRNLTTVVEMVPPNAQPFALDPNQVRITLIGENRAVEILGCTL